MFISGLGHFNQCGEFTQVLGDIEHENIVELSSRADCVLAVSGMSMMFVGGEYWRLTVGGEYWRQSLYKAQGCVLTCQSCEWVETIILKNFSSFFCECFFLISKYVVK